MKRFRIILSALFVFAALVLSGCGIDTYVYLYPVSSLLNTPSSVDPSLNYFQFSTSDGKNYDTYGDNGYFKGFDIYYRIYNSSSDRSTDVSEIYTHNENYPTATATWLVSTKKYTRMVRDGRTYELPLIPGSDSNRIVTIRLSDDVGYTASFFVGSSDDSSDSLGRPLRNPSNKSSPVTFDFDEIDSSDADVKYSASAGKKEWYVQAYVVAYGYDESYKPYYSEVFSLAYTTIKP